MNKKYLLILLLGVFCMPNTLKAQQYIEVNYYSDNYSSPGMSMIYGNIFNTKLKEKKEKTITKQLSVGLRMSFYNRVNNHTSYVFSPFLRYQKTLNSGILFQPELGVGYMYKKNNIPTFEYTNGFVKELNRAGHHRFNPSLSIGVGYNFIKKPACLFRFISDLEYRLKHLIT